MKGWKLANLQVYPRDIKHEMLVKNCISINKLKYLNLVLNEIIVLDVVVNMKIANRNGFTNDEQKMPYTARKPRIQCAGKNSVITTEHDITSIKPIVQAVSYNIDNLMGAGCL